MPALVQPDLPTGRLSFTQIDTYLTCPTRYKFKYIEKPELIPVGVSRLIGASIHEIIAIVLSAKIGGVRADLDKILADAHKRLADEFIKINQNIENVTGIQEPLTQAIMEMLHDQHDRLFKQWCTDVLPEFMPTAVEKQYETTIGGYPFIIYIDAIHAGKRVVDWKVTGSPKGKNQVDNSLQLSVYSIAAEVDEVAFCSLIRPKEGKERNWKPSVSMVTGRRTKADRDWAISIVKSTAEAIRARNFPLCSPENFLCSVKYCDFYPMCRGKQKIETTAAQPSWMKAFV